MNRKKNINWNRAAQSLIQPLPNTTAKIIATVGICLIVLASGVSYQYRYHQRKAEYTKAITGYYWKYFNRAPDRIGLRHWVTWALNKGGLAKVEKIGFIDAKAKGAA